MFKNYNLNKTDIRLTKNQDMNIGNKIDYKNQVCKKPWGYEFLSYMSNKIGIWILHVKKNSGTSIHTHFKKDTFLTVLNGKLKLEMVDEIDIINTGSFCFIPKRKFHGLSALEENTIFMEIEIYDNDVNFSDKNDLLRLIDKYKRAKTGYENSVKIIKENLKDYNYFEIKNNFKLELFNTILISDKFINLYKNKSSNVILLEGQIFNNGKILKEGSLFKYEELKNFNLNDQIFLQFINNNEITDKKIISSEEELIFIKEKLKKDNKKIILTCGCFDILHVGHIEMLKKSKDLGDILIVCLSSDEEIKHLKGKNRPINCLEDRLKLFSIIPYVDYIYVYHENLSNRGQEELDKIMNIVDPDIWTKGGDYDKDTILKMHPNLEKIVIIDLIEGKSTTNIIKKTNI